MNFVMPYLEIRHVRAVKRQKQQMAFLRLNFSSPYLTVSPEFSFYTYTHTYVLWIIHKFIIPFTRCDPVIEIYQHVGDTELVTTCVSYILYTGYPTDIYAERYLPC